MARSVFGDEAISTVLTGDYFGKKCLAMTIFLVSGHTLKLVAIRNRSPGESKQFSFFVSRSAVDKVCQNILKPIAPHKKIAKDNVGWI